MKKLLSLLLMLGLLCSLCACAESRQDETVPTEEPGVTEEPTDPTADQSQTPVSDGDLMLTGGGQVADEPWPELTEEESAGGYVRLHNYVRIDYVNILTQEPYDAHYIVPEFTLESEDALACNQEIRETCDPITERAIERAKTSSAVDAVIDYDAWHQEGVVSLCVSIQSPFGTSDYLVYTLDAETGELLDNARVAALAGLSEDAYLEPVRQAMLTYFEDGSYSIVEDAFYTEQREKTVADENLTDVTLFLGDGGELYALARIYAIAGGAEYHWELVPVGVD